MTRGETAAPHAESRCSGVRSQQAASRGRGESVGCERKSFKRGSCLPEQVRVGVIGGGKWSGGALLEASKEHDLAVDA